MALFAFIFFDITFLFCQVDPEIIHYNAINNTLKKELGSLYQAGDILDVDDLPTLSEDDKNALHEDRNNQFQHCSLVLYSKLDPESGTALNDSGAIAIIRDSKIIWQSNPFILGYLQTSSRIIGYADLNEDGSTDIVCAVGGGSHFETESYWIISQNPTGGKLLNSTYSNGYSAVIGATETFSCKKLKGSKFREIQVLDYQSEKEKTITYRWNGSVFSIAN